MLTSLYRRDRPALLLTLPLLVFICSGALLREPAPPEGAHMPLYAVLVDLGAQARGVTAVMAMLFLMGIAAQLVFLANDAELFERRNHLVALLFPMLVGLGPGGPHLNAALAGMPFIIWALRRLWVPRSRVGDLGTLFDAGFLLGLASLFYLPYAFLLVVVWASNAVMRPFHWRDHVVPIVGSALAFFLCWGVLFVSGAGSWKPMATLVPAARNAMPSNGGFLRTLLYAVTLLFAAAAAAAFARSYRRSVMQGKNLRAALLAFTLACAVLIGFEMIMSRSFPSVLAAVPLSLLFAYPLLDAKRTWIAEVGVLALAALLLWTQWGTGLSSPA